MNLMLAGKKVGSLVGGTLIKSGKQVQLFNNLDGFGIAKKLLHDPRIHRIKIIYNDMTYTVDVDTFLRKGFPYHKEPFEEQLILSRKYFHKDDPKQPRLI